MHKYNYMPFSVVVKILLQDYKLAKPREKGVPNYHQTVRKQEARLLLW